ncbi:hypothetical protein QUA20_28000 [Microcoleus sp. Pol7_A1]
MLQQENGTWVKCDRCYIPNFFSKSWILALQIIDKCYKLEANNCGTDNGVG